MGADTDPGTPVVTGRAGTDVSGSPDALEAAEAQAAAEAELLLAATLVPGTRPEVVVAQAAARAARADLEDELERLEAAARAAIDVRAKIRRNPAKVAGAAAGLGFLAVGGPQKVFRRARYAVTGKPDPLPKSMLPDDIDKALRALGDDGTKIRGSLERNFAAYLEQNAPERKGRSKRELALFFLLPLSRILVLRFGRQFIDEVLSTRGSFDEQLAKVRERRSGSSTEPPPSL
jgi:hypothetical protein